MVFAHSNKRKEGREAVSGENARRLFIALFVLILLVLGGSDIITGFNTSNIYLEVRGIGVILSSVLSLELYSFLAKE